jgi:hypothetical protein
MLVVIWSPGYQRWLSIGKVTSSKGAQREKVFDNEGRSWDFCITVNLEDGRNLPLYVNYDTNQYIAARDFITKHNLQMFYLDTIAKFIEREMKPYKVELESHVTMVKSSVFPMTVANLMKDMNIAPIIRKLQSLNDNPDLLLGPSDFELLVQQVITPQWFALVVDLALKWPPAKSWPVLDILRARIVEPNAKAVIDGERLTVIVNFLSSSPDLDDFATVILMRLIGNMFANYVGEALTGINILEVLCNFGHQFSSFSARTQLSWVNTVMNYTAFLQTDDRACDVLVDVLIDFFSLSLDEETLYRLLYAIGNVAIFSDKAMNKLRLRPDLIDAKMSLNPAPRIAQLLTGLVDLIK